MSIRRAQLDDSRKIQSLIMQAVEPHRYDDFDEEGWETFCKPNELGAIQNRINDPNYLTLCYLETEKIVGIITLYNFEKLDQLFIHPSARRKGIATKLWSNAKAICEAEGNKNHYWVKSSTMAIPLYKSFGFRVTGSCQNEKGITFYPMALAK